MRVKISTRFMYGWVEFENGNITKTCQIWEAWVGRAIVGLFNTFQDKKYPIHVYVDDKPMLVNVFYAQYQEEFLPKEASNGSESVA